MKRQLKIVISGIFYLLSWPFLPLAGLVGRRPRLVILYYHDIPAARRARFARQMDQLKRRATVVGADWRGGPAKGRVCAITFDDAFVSVMDNALPELEQRQLPCTIFVPVGALGGPPGWQMESNYAPGEVVADQQLISRLASPLVQLGAHTMSHPFLSRLPRESARAEIEQSRAMLSAMTGRDVRMMSFPYGDYDEDVTAMCKTAGYDFVYGIMPQSINAQRGEFLRGRVSVTPDDSDLEFFLKMSGAYWWVTRASRIKQACLSPRRSKAAASQLPPQSQQAAHWWSRSL